MIEPIVATGDASRTLPGVALALSLGGASLLLGAGLRSRLPGALLILLLAACGAGIGAGALMVLDVDPGPANWVATTVSLAVVVPFHVRVVFGPLGRPRA